MYISEKFKGKKSLGRAGVLTKVTLPSGLKVTDKVDFTLNKAKHSIDFMVSDKDGSTYAICSEFGVSKEVYISYFFIQGGVVLEVLSGSIYLRDKKGDVYSLSDKGLMSPVISKRQEDIEWVDYFDYLRHNAEIYIQHKYNLPETLISDYVNNLAFHVMLDKHSDTVKCDFMSKIVDIFLDLGLDEFEFKYHDYVQQDYTSSKLTGSTKKARELSDDADDVVLDDEELEDDTFIAE